MNESNIYLDRMLGGGEQVERNQGTGMFNTVRWKMGPEWLLPGVVRKGAPSEVMVWRPIVSEGMSPVGGRTFQAEKRASTDPLLLQRKHIPDQLKIYLMNNVTLN